MSVTLTKVPSPICPAGNDIRFRLKTTNAYASEGLISKYGLVWNHEDVDGNSITFSWLNHSVTFTASAQIQDPDGIHYPIYNGQTMIEYSEIIIPYLKANYLFSKYFFIHWNNSQNCITIQSRSVGSQYTISFSYDSVSIAFDLTQNGEDRVLNEGFKLIARIYKWIDPETMVDHEFLGEILLSPNDLGEADFKIQDFLLASLNSSFAYPEDNQVKVIERPEMRLRYFIEYLQFYDNTYFAVKQSGTSFYCFPGTISLSKFQYLQKLGISFYDELQANQSFLSWHPETKLVSTWQPEKLYFINHTASQVLKFKLTVYKDDGTIQTSILYEVDSESLVKVYEVCCGHDQLGLQYNVSTVLQYTVFVTDAADVVISEIKTFEVDQSSHKNDRAFIFLNSLGAYETFRSTGQFSKSNAFNFQTAQIIKEDDSLSFQVNSNHSAFYEETFVGNSGWVTKEELLWINDFIISPESFIIEKWKLFPIVITSKKVFQHKDQSNLFFVKFEFKKSMKSAAYSNQHSLDPLLDESAISITTEDNNFIFV